jgi:RND family efflux transporter MFP subunit
MYIYKSVFAICLLLFLSCTQQNQSQKIINIYPVVNPIVKDTSYITEYVADIQSYQNIELRSKIDGFIEKINIDEGQFVHKGEVLFSINNKENKENVAKTKGALKSEESILKKEKVEYLNIKKLVEKNIVSTTDLEKAEAELELAKANVEQANSEYNNALYNVSLSKITAPFDGFIHRIPNKVGSLIDAGTLLSTLSNNKYVYAYFHVSEREYLDYTLTKNKGEKGEVELLLANNQKYSQKGIIESIDGEINKSTGNIAFRAKFENPTFLLKHGSTGKIIIKKRIKNATLIPQKSTFEIQDKIYIYLVNKNNIVHPKAIKPLIRIPNYYIVSSSDINPKALLIFEGGQNIKKGDQIKIIKKNIR